MPAFPTYERGQGLGGGATASFASEGAFTAPARAMQGFGNTLEDAGAVFQERAQQFQNTQDDVWFSKARAETTVEMYNAEQELRQSATNTAEGFVPAVQGRFEQVKQARLQQAPSPRAQAMYDEWSFSYNADLTQSASRFQAESALAKRTDDFASTILSHSQMVLSDPSSYDRVYKRAMDDLEGAKQWLTPEQEIAARQSIDEQLQMARAQGEIQRDPQAFLESIGVTSDIQTGDADSVVEKIIQIESGGNANAKNPRSSASGLGQFTDSTWYATVAKHRPDLAAQGRAIVMGLKNDPALQREMLAAHTQDNAEFLQSRGMPATAGNIYLAHFAGAGGAEKVLSASPDRSVESVLGASVVNANPFLRGKDVAWLRNWAADKMGDANPSFQNNPQFASLSPDQILGLTQQATSASSKMRAEMAARAEAEIAQRTSSLEQGIILGDTSVTQQAILSAGLSTDQENKLLRQLDTASGDRRMAQDALTRLQSGDGFDIFDGDDRKGVSLAYDFAVGESSIFGEGPAQATLQDVYERSGIVPRRAMNEIRSGLISTDPKMAGAAASVAARLYAADPGSLGKAENGAELVKAAQQFQHFTNTLGLTPEQAGQRIVDLNDPEKMRQREALLDTKPVQDRLKGITANEVGNLYDPGLFGFDPKPGSTPMAEAAMIGDYRSMLEESIVENGGDMYLAEQQAADRFKRMYAPSAMTLDGDAFIVKYPPEVTYPAVDGSHDYVMSQAMEALTAEGVEAEQIWLQPSIQTEQDFNAGRPPRYDLYYRNGGKVERYNLPFFAEPDIARAQARVETRQQFEDNRNRELEAFPDGRPRNLGMQRFEESQRETGRMLRGEQ